MPSSACQKSARSEEHTSELQSHSHLVCRLLLEKKNKHKRTGLPPTEGVRDRRTDGRRRAAPPRGCLSVQLLGAPPLSHCFHLFFFFFLNDRAPPEIYPLPLHDALPI